MGKVKIGLQIFVAPDVVVSIPYGKGKVLQSLLLSSTSIVSIPYGKGKAICIALNLWQWYKYQFPMGKVKFVLLLFT